MVRGGLQGDVEGNLHTERVRFGDEGSKVVERAETRLDGIVTAIGAADGVGDAGVALARAEGVVLPLAKRRADRVDGSEVDDVETHLGYGYKALRRLGEGGAAGGIGSGGAGNISYQAAKRAAGRSTTTSSSLW